MILSQHGINSTRKNKYEQEYDETDIPPSTSIGMVPLDRIGWNVTQTMTSSRQDIPFNRERIGWNVTQTMTSSRRDIPFDRDRIGWNITLTMTETLVQ